MGVRASCICDPSSRREVFVMKENGEFLKFKEYIRVKHILAANPYHKVIRCCSQDTNNDILPDSFQLSCNQLYFLLPRGFFLTHETYQNMLTLAASASSSRNSINFSASTYGGNIPQLPSESNANVLLCSKDNEDDDSDTDNSNSSRWKPALKTIPELNSPLPAGAATLLSDFGCSPEPITGMHGDDSGYKQELIVTSTKRKQEVALA